uniref:Uncharacterized protein n=1 Tax=Clytia hemisphaerica TaxID=252671 RepID=A0A7M5XF92_9CNID|eukprot:TCONS_00004881-protein
MRVLNIICLLCLVTLIKVTEGRPKMSKCVVTKIRWSGIECQEIDKSIDEKKLMAILARNYKSKFTSLLKGYNGKGPMRADVKKRLLKELAKARNLLWAV